MSVSTITPLEQSVHTANQWLQELAEDLGRDDRQQAYRMMRAVLLALRDRLTTEEAADLGAQLPMLIRGIYYDGFNPSKTPTSERTLEGFLDHVAENLQDGVDGSPEQVARAVFKLVSHHITEGEVNHVRANLPSEIKTLWQ